MNYPQPKEVKAVLAQQVNKPKKADIFIIIFTALCGVILYIILNTFILKGIPSTAVIEVEGKVWGEYRLSGIDGEKVIDVDTKNGHNRVILGTDYAYVSDADCGNLTCVKSGKITKPGEIIVCIPNMMTVKLTGDKEFDVVSH